MSETKTKVTATVKDIKAAFPKAKSEFVIRCMEKEMDMEQVATAMTEEMTTENETLLARVAAMEQEMAALKAAKAQEQQVPGAAPVGNLAGNNPGPSARQAWNDAISESVKRGMTKQQAVLAVNRSNPGLREKMLAEVR